MVPPCPLRLAILHKDLMMPKTLFILLLSVLCLIAPARPTAAQYGPQPGGNPPAGQPDNAAGALALPDYIKPGYQFLYVASSSTESDDPNKVGSAGMGFTEYTIIAVLKDKVLVNAANYLAPNGVPLTPQGDLDTNTDPRVQFSGGTSFTLGALEIQGGRALWMDVEQLKQMQGGNGVDVVRSTWPYKGQQVNAVTVTVRGNDSISSSTYLAESGAKLVDRMGSGPLRRGDIGANPYNRKYQSLMQLVETRQFKSPLIGAAWPDWTQRVKAMNFAGTYSMNVPGLQAPPVQMSLSISFTERGEGYILGKSTSQVQGNAPQTSLAMQGPGTALGYWVHPDVLAKLKQGQIDENKTLRTTLSYQVQDGNLGRLGVFVLNNEAQTFYAVSAYNLQTGALTYISHHLADTGTTIEYTLQGIESE